MANGGVVNVRIGVAVCFLDLCSVVCRVGEDWCCIERGVVQ